MDEHVVARPLLVKSGVEYTQLAVEPAQGLDGSSHVVMYLGTCEYRVPEYTWHEQSRGCTQAEAGKPLSSSAPSVHSFNKCLACEPLLDSGDTVE